MDTLRTTSQNRTKRARALAGCLAFALAAGLPCTAALAAPGAGGAPGTGSAGTGAAATEQVSVPATGVTLNAAQLTVMAGTATSLSSQVTPANTTDALTWTSSDPAVVAVSDTGALSALKAGTATVTATAGAVSASCTVTVWQPVTSIELNRSAIIVQATQKRLLKATCLPEDATNKNVVWSSSDENVATVDANGMVTAVATGTATITCTAADGAGAQQTCSVTVLNNATAVKNATELATPHPYANDCTDAWSFSIPGAWALSVTFDNRTELEYTYDYAVIYDADGLMVGYYTGTELAGKTIQVSGDTVWVQLVSDEVTDGWGFAVTSITAVPKPEPPTPPEQAQQPATSDQPNEPGTGENQSGTTTPENPGTDGDQGGTGDQGNGEQPGTSDNQGGTMPENPGADDNQGSTEQPTVPENPGASEDPGTTTPEDPGTGDGQDATDPDPEETPWDLEVDGAVVTCDYLSFTLPDAWVGQVEVSVEKTGAGDEYLSVHLPSQLDADRVELAAFRLADAATDVDPGESAYFKLAAAWNSSDTVRVELWVTYWDVLANSAENLGALPDAATLDVLIQLATTENFTALVEKTVVPVLDADGTPTGKDAEVTDYLNAAEAEAGDQPATGEEAPAVEPEGDEATELAGDDAPETPAA